MHKKGTRLFSIQASLWLHGFVKKQYGCTVITVYRRCDQWRHMFTKEPQRSKLHEAQNVHWSMTRNHQIWYFEMSAEKLLNWFIFNKALNITSPILFFWKLNLFDVMCLEHPAGWICAHYKSLLLLLLLCGEVQNVQTLQTDTHICLAVAGNHPGTLKVTQSINKSHGLLSCIQFIVLMLIWPVYIQTQSCFPSSLGLSTWIYTQEKQDSRTSDLKKKKSTLTDTNLTYIQTYPVMLCSCFIIDGSSMSCSSTSGLGGLFS